MGIQTLVKKTLKYITQPLDIDVDDFTLTSMYMVNKLISLTCVKYVNGKIPSSSVQGWLNKIIDVRTFSISAPSIAEEGDKYYNPSSKLLFTFTSGAWDLGGTPLSNVVYYNIEDDGLSYKWNGSTMICTTGSLSGYVPVSRTISINGTTLDLSANRSWTIQNTLIPTSVKTANYTASVNDLVLTDIATTGSFTVTLPSAPADKSRIQVNLIANMSGRQLTVACGGTDKFNTTTGDTVLYMQNSVEVVQLQYIASSGVWLVQEVAECANFATNFPGIDSTTPITAANISINYSTRVLTVTPTLGYFNIYIDGTGVIKKYRKTTVNFPAFTDTSGWWYFYFDVTGTAITTQTPWTDFNVVASVYRVLWRAGLGDSVRESEETHLNTIAGDDHEWKHIYGAIHVSGYDIASNVTAGTPNASGINTCIGLTSGTCEDDNLKCTVISSTSDVTSKFTQDLGMTVASNLTTSNGGKFPIRYDIGSIPYILPATRFPFHWDSGANTPYYIDTSGSFQAVTNNRYFVYYVYSFSDPRNGRSICLVSATTDFTTLLLAQNDSWLTIRNNYANLRDNEIRPLYKLIFQYKSAYNVAIKKTGLIEVDDIRTNPYANQPVGAGSNTTAAGISYTPTGDITATDVQALGIELQTDLNRIRKRRPFVIATAVSVTAGQTVYLKSDGTIALANATTISTMPVLGVAESSGTAGQTINVIEGEYTSTAHGFTIGTWLCQSAATAGGLVAQTSPPSATDNIEQAVCWVVDANTLDCNPQMYNTIA